MSAAAMLAPSHDWPQLLHLKTQGAGERLQAAFIWSGLMVELTTKPMLQSADVYSLCAPMP